MLKGNERRVIMLKGGRDSFYDMACIFIRNDLSEHPEDDNVVKKAEEIIERALAQSNSPTPKKAHIITKRISSFIIGMLIGSVISVLSYLLVCVLFFT